MIVNLELIPESADFHEGFVNSAPMVMWLYRYRSQTHPKNHLTTGPAYWVRTNLDISGKSLGLLNFLV